MRNITKEQQRKCIYMRLGDFEDVIRKVSLDVWVSYTQNKISPDTYGEKPFDKQRYLLGLSKYFDVTVTGVHIDFIINVLNTLTRMKVSPKSISQRKKKQSINLTICCWTDAGLIANTSLVTETETKM